MKFFTRTHALDLFLKPFNPAYSKLARRSLWFLSPPRPELVIGNNTALFAVLASLRKHGIDQHPQLRLICPEFWLDTVHQSYLDESWGQTQPGLPKVARDMFARLYPQHNLDKILTLRQVQELRIEALRTIEEDYRIPVYYGNPAIKQLADKNFNITIQQSIGEVSLQAAEDTCFYFWYRVPKILTMGGMAHRSNIEIYKQPPDHIPNNVDIVTMGGGLSVMWLAKHFTHESNTRRIICIKYRTDTLPSIPANQAIDMRRIIVLDIDKTDISFAKTHPEFAVVYSHEHRQTYRGVFYTSLGTVLPLDVIKEVPETQVMSPRRWPVSKWIAAKNIPRGSLMENILQWFEITDNIKWGFEPQSYHEAANNLICFLKSECADLIIDAMFFHALEASILQLDNPLPDEEVKPFLVELYSKTYRCTPQQTAIFARHIDRLLAKQPNYVHEPRPSRVC